MPRMRRQAAAGGADGAVGFVAYYRVSTEQQGRSGLGLDAQKEAVSKYIAGHPPGQLLAEFQEVESGKRSDRPQLAAALAACRARRAVLVIAKLDRLARNVSFLLSVAEGVGEGGLVFCDLPTFPVGPMGKFFLTIMAAVAELEAGLISQRTIAALKAAKARGTKLGNPQVSNGSGALAAKARAARSVYAADFASDALPYIRAAQAAGATSLRQIAAALVARGVRTAYGEANWTPTQVKRLLDRNQQATPA